MARYVKRVEVIDPNLLTGEITAFFQGNGYELVDDGGEVYWRKGDGFWVASRCAVINYEPGAVVITAFVNSGGIEMGVTGFYGWAIKKPFRKLLAALEEMLRAKGGKGAGNAEAAGTV